MQDIRSECLRLLTTYVRKDASGDIGLGHYVRQSTVTRAEGYVHCLPIFTSHIIHTVYSPHSWLGVELAHRRS
jgi:hypothetical protein